ncbi:MAG: hypothetical protein PHU23_03340 [Dehalococcoidales bacterium]|nr:hypothetical protein [Dehalococcoidales bacterium]
MERIPIETVVKVINRMDSMDEKKILKFAERVLKEQPDLVAFLMAIDDDILNQDEREQLYYLGTSIWAIMSEGKLRLPRITNELLAKADEANLNWLESAGRKKSVSMEKLVERMLMDYPQPVLLGFAVMVLAGENDEECNIRDESRSVILLDVKTVIDCFDQI